MEMSKKLDRSLLKIASFKKAVKIEIEVLAVYFKFVCKRLGYFFVLPANVSDTVTSMETMLNKSD